MRRGEVSPTYKFYFYEDHNNVTKSSRLIIKLILLSYRKKLIILDLIRLRNYLCIKIDKIC